jgi:hypothetical protein
MDMRSKIPWLRIHAIGCRSAESVWHWNHFGERGLPSLAIGSGHTILSRVNPILRTALTRAVR